MINKIDRIVECIKSKTDLRPDTGLILGSGLGSYADKLDCKVEIPYSDIEGFPISTVAGHAGQFVIGKRAGKTVIAMQGRVHFYEGYSQAEITLPVRVMQRLGVRDLVLTNAAGGVNKTFAVGALMLITDHINFSGTSPLIGPNLDEFGTRFPDMGDIYTKSLREKVIIAAKSADIPLEQGVYMMFSGPSYETPAEVRMARVLGADAVGMSTAPEALVACHSGMRVVGISCITNPAAGVMEAPLNHTEVVEVTKRVHGQFVSLLDVILENI